MPWTDAISGPKGTPFFRFIFKRPECAGIDVCLNHVIESHVRHTYISDRRRIEQASALDRLGKKLTELITLENGFATFT